MKMVSKRSWLGKSFYVNKPSTNPHKSQKLQDSFLRDLDLQKFKFSFICVTVVLAVFVLSLFHSFFFLAKKFIGTEFLRNKNRSQKKKRLRDR